MNYLDPTIETSPISTTFSPKMAHKTHVLLVEHDSIDHDIYMKMLQYFSFEVTTVRLASTGASILSKQEIQFDLVMANMNSPDSCVFQLLEVALQMNLLVILMSNNDDAITNMRTLEHGALFCIKKPVTMQMMRNLWQHVIIEKGGRLKQKEQAGEVIEFNTLPKEFGEDFMEGNQNDNVEGKYKSKRKVNAGTSQNDNVTFTKKVWVEWTEELHVKFMGAVTQLGEGRCYPRAILDLMNVPQLSRMQVASHLQRCRNAKWLPPSKRKSKLANGAETSTPPKNKARLRTKTVSFGSMPRTNNKRDRQKLTIDPPPTETNMLIDYNCDGSSNNGYQYPQLLDAQDCETFDMGQLGQIFGMDDVPVVYGVESVDPVAHFSLNERDMTEDVFDFLEMDSMVQDFSVDSQQELGMDYDGTLEALVLDQLNLNQVPTVTNATNQWNQDGWTESMNDE